MSTFAREIKWIPVVRDSLTREARQKKEKKRSCLRMGYSVAPDSETEIGRLILNLGLGLKLRLGLGLRLSLGLGFRLNLR